MNGFGDLPRRYRRLDSARAVLIPVPYDRTSTWLKGAARGPRAIIDASAHMELYDIETDSEPYRVGLATDRAVEERSSPEAMVEAVRRRVASHLEAGRLPVVVGGEHSVTVGAAFACADRHPGLTVLQLDAHADLRREYQGSRFSHACVMARLKERCPAVQVGIRSMDVSEKPYLDPARVFFAEKSRLDPHWPDRAVELLAAEVYLTVDLDVLDPGVMPATGTPEPGGLGWYEVLELLRRVFTQRTVVGFDVVELCPREDPAPDFLAARLIYKMLGYRFAGEAQQGKER